MTTQQKAQTVKDERKQRGKGRHPSHADRDFENQQHIGQNIERDDAQSARQDVDRDVERPRDKEVDNDYDANRDANDRDSRPKRSSVE